MRRLLWAFAGLTYHIVGNLMSRLKNIVKSICIMHGNLRRLKDHFLTIDFTYLLTYLLNLLTYLIKYRGIMNYFLDTKFIL